MSPSPAYAIVPAAAAAKTVRIPGSPTRATIRRMSAHDAA